MPDMSKKEEIHDTLPGVCVPWEKKIKEFGLIAGNPETIKREWEKIDAFAYVYLWYWVHR